MEFSWSGRRQLLYYAVGLVVCGVLLVVFYNFFLVHTPSCFDGTQNQDERGVDCGGVCSLICLSDTHSLKVLWARSFEVAPGYYTAAAYIHNDNLTAGARGVKYSFQLFDEDNLLIVERDGQADIAPIPTMPLVESNIKVGNRAVARTLFSFVTTPTWLSAKAPVLRVSNQVLEQDGSRFSASVVNDSLTGVRHVAVNTVLFDARGVALAASRSTVDVGAKSTQKVVFTWPLGVPGVVRAEITVVPPF